MESAGCPDVMEKRRADERTTKGERKRDVQGERETKKAREKERAYCKIPYYRGWH